MSLFIRHNPINLESPANYVQTKDFAELPISVPCHWASVVALQLGHRGEVVGNTTSETPI